MKRYATERLERWLAGKRRKPLVLRGARQVGKSTLIRQFAAAQKRDLIEINLERYRSLDGIFGSFDTAKILLNLQALTGRQITSNSLLFLDEIQAAPQAIPCLRYFYENEPDLPVVAAGSLLEFALADHSFSMPVGRVEYLHLRPMTFCEFLEEADPLALEFLHTLDPFAANEFPEEAHKRLLRWQRVFMIVGGMPEAVLAYTESRGAYGEVRSVHNSILGTYIDDFSKYAKQGDLADLQRLFRAVPGNVGRKTKYVHLLPDARSAHARRLLDLLIKAQVVTPVLASDCSGVPLAAGVRPGIMKLLFLDVGLSARQLGQEFIDFENLDERMLVNEGPWAEQFIGQHLYLDSHYETAPEFYYWLNEGTKANAELDYVLAQGNLLVPVEVKAGKSGTLKSLHLFVCLRGLSHGVRFDAGPPSLTEVNTSASTSAGQQAVSYTLISLPLYAVERLQSLLVGLRRAG